MGIFVPFCYKSLRTTLGMLSHVIDFNSMGRFLDIHVTVLFFAALSMRVGLSMHTTGENCQGPLKEAS